VEGDLYDIFTGIGMGSGEIRDDRRVNDTMRLAVWFDDPAKTETAGVRERTVK